MGFKPASFVSFQICNLELKDSFIEQFRYSKVPVLNVLVFPFALPATHFKVNNVKITLNNVNYLYKVNVIPMQLAPVGGILQIF